MGIRNTCDLALSWVLFSIARLFQLALGLAVCGLYGVDLQAAKKAGVYQDSRWVYAEVVGGLAAFSAVLYMIPFVMRIPFAFVWDFILFFMWIVLFAIFGNMYIKENAEGDAGITRMKHAVWVDLANALLWLFTALAMAGFWWKNRSTKSQFTGRATV